MNSLKFSTLFLKGLAAYLKDRMDFQKDNKVDIAGNIEYYKKISYKYRLVVYYMKNIYLDSDKKQYYTVLEVGIENSLGTVIKVTQLVVFLDGYMLRLGVRDIKEPDLIKNFVEYYKLNTYKLNESETIFTGYDYTRIIFDWFISHRGIDWYTGHPKKR